MRHATHDHLVSVPPTEGTIVRTPLPGGGCIAEHWWAGGDLTVTLSGEVDEFDRPQLVDVLTACLLAGARHVDFDLADVGFVDVAVVRVLAGAAAFLARNGGTATIRHAGPRAQDVWDQLTGRLARVERVTAPIG